MLYEIKVYKLSGSKKKKLYSMEIQARDEINALEKANVRLWMIVRVETNRKIVASDVVTNMGNLGRLFLISIKKLMEKK